MSGFIGFGDATYFSAVCVDTTGLPKVQVQINKNSIVKGVEHEVQLIIGGDSKDISLITHDSNTTQALPGVNNNLLFKRSNSNLTILFSTGVSLTVAVANVRNSSVME